LKEGRFGEWLREVKDWALSRERYWGTPLPIWKCQSCGHLEVIGGREDLIKQKFSKNRYLILRHGESEMNVKGILISTLPEKVPCPLTEKGKEQILKVAKKLKKEKIDLIISSDLLRTRQTSEILAKELRVKVIFDKRLRDIKFGIFEGKTLEEYHSFWKSYQERFEKAPRGGENYNRVKMRIYNFFKALEKKYSGKTILIVGHQRPFAMLEGAVKGYSIKEFFEKIEPRKMKNGELREIEFKILPYDRKGNLDFHKPYIDEIKFFCPKCQGEMRRVSEVIDCWFDSGAMPFAQYHWPFSEIPNSKFQIPKLRPPKLFPADYIAEGIDQTRGWFYTLLAISTLMGFGPAYKNVISLGHVLDEKGEKMSKSKGNVVDPWYIIQKYGVEATRWYFFTFNQPWDPKLFSEKDIAEILRKFILTFWNCYLFFETYGRKKELASPKSKNILDKWIVSRIESLIKEVTKNFENYDITRAGRLIEKFVIEDLSLWYIRRARRRFQKPENERELKEASQTLKFVLLNLSKILAPFLPFLSEFIYQRIQNLNFNFPISVHLENWPKVNEKLIDKKLERKMEKVREIVSLALAERQKAKIKVRQPLNELQTTSYWLKKEPELIELIKEEVNVKKISFGRKLKLNTKITPELKKEGMIREVIRHIQEMRKEVGLKPRDKIFVGYFGSENISEILEKNKKDILKEARILDLKIKEGQFDLERKVKVDDEEIILAIKKVNAKSSSAKRAKA
jgi:isoleucyl-tRNA synthetase